MKLERAHDRLDAPLERPAPPLEHAPRHAHGRRLPLVVAGLAVLIFAASVGYAYRQGMVDARGGGEVPTVRAEDGPTRLKPEEPGGLQVPNQDKLVYERMTGARPGEHVERLLPPPEMPLPKPSEAPSQPESDIKVGVTTSVALKLPKAKPETPAAALAKPTPGKADDGLPPLPTARPTTLPSGSFGLQLAALRDPNAIPPLWRKLQASHDGILGKLRVKILRITVAEKGVFHRLLAGPYPTEATARVACQSLKSRNQDCFVVRY